jgi:hypothetical protein
MLRRIPPKNMEVPRALPVGLHKHFFTFYKFNPFDTIEFPKGDINSVENVFYDAKTK